MGDPAEQVVGMLGEAAGRASESGQSPTGHAAPRGRRDSEIRPLRLRAGDPREALPGSQRRRVSRGRDSRGFPAALPAPVGPEAGRGSGRPNRGFRWAGRCRHPRRLPGQRPGADDVPKPEIRTTEVPEVASISFSQRQTSTPFPSGRTTSRRIRSGRRRFASRRHSAAVNATSTVYPAALPECTMEPRSTGSSSTSRRYVVGFMSPSADNALR